MTSVSCTYTVVRYHLLCLPIHLSLPFICSYCTPCLHSYSLMTVAQHSANSAAGCSSDPGSHLVPGQLHTWRLHWTKTNGKVGFSSLHFNRVICYGCLTPIFGCSMQLLAERIRVGLGLQDLCACVECREMTPVRSWVEGVGNEVVFGGGVLSVLGVLLVAYVLTARPRYCFSQ